MELTMEWFKQAPGRMVLFVTAILLAGGSCAGAILIGWQGVADTLPNRMYFVGIMMIAGLGGFFVAKIIK